MHDNLFNKTNIKENNVHFLNCETTDVSKEVASYEK